MALIRNTASALRKGRVGNETYYVALNKQIVRVAQNDSNYGESASRTPQQQGNRVKWANLVNFYKISSSWMKKAFENKKSSQTDYNRFMQLNLPLSRIFLTKEAAQAGAVVADQFAVSQGSLRSISITQLTDSWQTDIKLGSLTIGDSTTVADFTAAVIANNNWAELNMQISFVSYQQSTDPFGFPKAVCTAYELTLDNADTRLVRNLLPSFCSQSKTGGFLGTSNEISIGAFAYVLSITKGGKTMVSTQTLVTNNALMIGQWSSNDALQSAIASYGVTMESFLDSGSSSTEPTPQPFFVTGLSFDDEEKVYVAGGLGPRRVDASEKVGHIYLSTPLPSGVTLTSITFAYGGQATGALSNISIAADRRSVQGSFAVASSEAYVSKIIINLSTGSSELVFRDYDPDRD